MHNVLRISAAFASLALAAPGHAGTPASVASSPIAVVGWADGYGMTEGGRALIAVLAHASLDGFDDGPAIAAEASALVAQGRTGEANALLSQAWARYVQVLENRVGGMTYADPAAAPRLQSATQILSAAASTPSLAGLVRQVSAVNPVYSALRQAAIDAGRDNDPTVAADLARLRTPTLAGRYIIVDAASANLWMVEDGRIAGTMRVISGDETNATPMIASVIRDATFNPYWNVPEDFARETIAPRIVEQGISYLRERQYDVFASYAADAPRIDPSTVDWQAVAEGTERVRLRRGPGEWNSMGKVKFGFANDFDIYLHDTPDKSLFGGNDRNLSHGCIRLSDAPRLTAWMFGRKVNDDGRVPEQQVALPAPVPIYITRTASFSVDGERLALRDDDRRSAGMGVGR